MFSCFAMYMLKITLLMDNEKTYKNSERFLKDNGINVQAMLDKFERNSNKITIKSRHGHNIPARYILSNNNYDNTTMVLVHGHDMNLISTYPIADVLLNNGINVVLYDQRSHGENTAKEVTFGYYEKDDLEDVIDYIETKMTKKNSIGILGQSMGAATVGFYSGTEHANHHVAFAVLDCPYNNMKEIIKNTAIRRGYSEKALPLLILLGSIANKIYLNFSYADMDVAKSVQNSNIPMLVYSTKDDKTCPYYMADEVFDSIKHNNKGKIQFEQCGHIKGFYKNNDIYVSELLKFIEKSI